jgi:hypothetical protein
MSGFDECWSESMDQQILDRGNHIFNLTGHGTESYLKRGYKSLDQIPLPDGYEDPQAILSDGDKISLQSRQYLQILRARDTGMPAEYAKKKLFEVISQVQFPIFFLDFEAANLAVPFRIGSRAYESLVFQWSCHKMDKNLELSHFDWIQRRPGCYPNYEFVRTLMDIPELADGTIFQYSPFEKQSLKNIRRILKRDIKNGYDPDDSDNLLQWLNRVLDGGENNRPAAFVDMNKLVQDYYFHRDMNGSFGLKDAVAAIMRTSDTLMHKYSDPYQSSNFESVQWWQRREVGGQGRDPYSIIEDRGGDIKEGAEALMAFIRLQKEDMQPQKRNQMLDDLLKYCELDTLSMVMIYQHWQGMKK